MRAYVAEQRRVRHLHAYPPEAADEDGGHQRENGSEGLAPRRHGRRVEERLLDVLGRHVCSRPRGRPWLLTGRGVERLYRLEIASRRAGKFYPPLPLVRRVSHSLTLFTSLGMASRALDFGAARERQAVQLGDTAGANLLELF